MLSSVLLLTGVIKKGGTPGDSTLENQIAWFRRMLELKDDATDVGDLFDHIKAEIFQDRVYVLTPKGDIIDLPQGSTPLDFAYHIHTDVGHCCRGAKVNSRIVPLNYQLQNGDQVAVLTVKESKPSRNWLLPHLGYLRSSRARAKVRQWFRQQNREKNLAAGRQILEQEFQRLDLHIKEAALEKVAGKYNFAKTDDLYAALGGGDITTSNVISFIQEAVIPAPRKKLLPFLPVKRKTKIPSDQGEVKIRGVGNLMTQMAQCCQPVPAEPILGFITQGRGVTIHRQDCPNLLNLQAQSQERIIEVDWAGETQKTYSVDVQINAYDRPVYYAISPPYLLMKELTYYLLIPEVILRLARRVWQSIWKLPIYSSSADCWIKSASYPTYLRLAAKGNRVF